LTNLNYTSSAISLLIAMQSKIMSTTLIVLLLFNALAIFVAAEPTIKLTTPYPSVEMKVAQKTVLKIKVENVGSSEGTFNLTITSPSGWESTLKSGSLIIKSIYLEALEVKELDLEITPPSGAKSGTYSFIVNSIDSHGAIVGNLNIQVRLPETIVQSGIKITSLVPSIEASSGESVEFRLNVINKNIYDTLIFFSAGYPQGWSVSFTPAYETVSVRSLEFSPSENQVVVAKITSPQGALPGTYTVEIAAETDEFKDMVSLNVFLVGKYDLKISPSNNLASFDLIQGESHAFSFYVNNTGTASLADLAIFSDKPSDWDISFEANTIPTLAGSAFKEVRAVLVAPKDTIPGDYLVTIYSSVSDLGISANLNYRVTVKGSVEWGFVGLGIILALVLLVGLIYWRMGRR
jgi:uncharacterized membrane protein